MKINPLKFLPVARVWRNMSKDPSTKVGAVAVDERGDVVASGYNGFPRGVSDCSHLLHDREQKYPRTVHAEMNIVAQAARKVLEGTSVVLTSLHPCSTCAGALIQAGVVKVYYPAEQDNRRWDESAKIAEDMFRQAGVELVPYGVGASGGALSAEQVGARLGERLQASQLRAGQLDPSISGANPPPTHSRPAPPVTVTVGPLVQEVRRTSKVVPVVPQPSPLGLTSKAQREANEALTKAVQASRGVPRFGCTEGREEPARRSWGLQFFKDCITRRTGRL